MDEKFIGGAAFGIGAWLWGLEKGSSSESI